MQLGRDIEEHLTNVVHAGERQRGACCTRRGGDAHRARMACILAGEGAEAEGEDSRAADVRQGARRGAAEE